MIARNIYYTFFVPSNSFPGSEEYWKQRYIAGETSGAGSYNKLAEFKAEVINSFIKNNKIRTVIEYGCGDGNQLRLSVYQSYIGFDVSPEAILKCMDIFSSDKTKTFKLMKDYKNETAQLTLSLDVIYHLIEDSIYIEYMKRLFDSSCNYVIIYSSNTNSKVRYHVKHRKFSKWVEQNRPKWKLTQRLPNRYPYNGVNDQEGSFADFYFYEKVLK